MAKLVYEITGNVTGLGQATKQATANLYSLEQSAARTNAALGKDITSIAQLKRDIVELNRQKVNIIDEAKLARQNKLIQELEAELTRAQNIGKAGFDETGVAIAKATKATEAGTGALGGLGKALGSSFGFIRQIAYILPGIGIAGIFGLAGSAILAAAEGLDIFNSKLTQTQQNQANINAINTEAAKSYGEQATSLRILYGAATDVTNAESARIQAAQTLQSTFPSTFGSLKTEAILNGESKRAYDETTASIISNAKARAAADQISKIAAKQFENDSQKQKIAAADQINLDKFVANTRRALIENVGLSGIALEKRLADVTQSAREQVALNQRTQLRALDEQNRQYEKQINFIQGVIGGNKTLAQAQGESNIGIQQRLEAEISSLEQRRKLSKSESEIGVLNIQIKQKQSDLDELLGRNTQSRITQVNKELSLRQQLDAIINKALSSASKSGLEGYSLEIKQIENRYLGLNREINKFIANVKNQESAYLKSGGKSGISPAAGSRLINEAQSTKAGLTSPFTKEIADASIKEAERVANEIQRINNEFGVKSQESKGRELVVIQSRYDAEVVKAKGNADILSALDAGRITAIEAINAKYEAIQADLQSKILGIQETTIATLTGREEEQTAKIQKEWETRRRALNGYYADLLKIASASNFNVTGAGIDLNSVVSGAIGGQQAKDNGNIDSASTRAVTNYLNKDFNNALKGVTRGFVSDLTNGLFNASSQAGYSFQSVFANVAESFNKTIQNGVFNVLQSQLEKKLQAGIDSGVGGLSGKLQAAVAGLAIAGGLVSGLTPKTSVVGQGLGGALSGAASGIAIGSVIPGIGTVAGGIAGGLIGLVGGIFGANKAQKDLQAQQLAEQKQQTDLLRQSIAYTASVIGRMTNQGVVTGVEIGAFGDLTTRISGSDIEVVLNRQIRKR